MSGQDYEPLVLPPASKTRAPDGDTGVLSGEESCIEVARSAKVRLAENSAESGLGGRKNVLVEICLWEHARKRFSSASCLTDR